MVNDTFIYAIILFIEGDYVKRMSVEEEKRIIQISAYCIQYKTFTYLRVLVTTINPKNLPKYPCDRHILLEIA